MAIGASLVAGRPIGVLRRARARAAQRRRRADQRLLDERPRAGHRGRDRHGRARTRLRRAARAGRPARRSSPSSPSTPSCSTTAASATKQVQAAMDSLVSGRPRPVSIEVPADRWRTPSRPACSTRPRRASRRSTRAPSSAPRTRLRARRAAADRRRRRRAGRGRGDRPARRALQAPVTDAAHGPRRDPDRASDVRPSRGRATSCGRPPTSSSGSARAWSGRSCTGASTTAMTIIKIDIDADELDRHGARRDRHLRRRRRRRAARCWRRWTGMSARPTAPARSPDGGPRYFADIDHLRPQLDFLAAIRDVLPDDGSSSRT